MPGEDLFQKSPMREIELKLNLTEAAEKRMRADRGLAAISTGRPRTIALKSVYFDTVDRRLAAAGIALRLRRQGRDWVQTLKQRGALRHGFSINDEFECPAPGGRLAIAAIPDTQAQADLKQALGTHALGPVCETRFRRTKRHILMPGAEIEMAIDVGEVTAGELREPLRELELELISGDPAALFMLLRRLLPGGGMRFSTTSKAARGMRLADGAAAPTPTARHARRVVLQPEQTIEAAAGDILREALDQIAGNLIFLEKIETPDPNGLKQLRIGLRRLRTVLTMLRSQLGGPAAAGLSEEARWLAAELGQVRDLDVALSEIVEPEMDGDAGFAHLHKALAARRNKARLRLMGEVLPSSRVQNFCVDLMAFVETRGWLARGDIGQSIRLAEPAARVARTVLAKRWRKVCRAAEGIADLDIEARHALRKELKKLRYAIEYMRALYPDETVKPFLKNLRKLQTLFGDLNDLAMAEALFLGPAAPAARDPQVQRAVGRILGARGARAELAWVSAQECWENLLKAPRFWQMTRS
ncbi:MAG: CHAD domain-containing protein [Pseudomonadota bacterium]